ncbi:MAG: helix-turn-helix transcriptional regulator, partial [Acholeplasmataceae bacterium]
IKNAEIVLIKRLGEVYYMKYDVAIKKLREKMIVSQEELSEILGVSLITVNRWENGKYEPTIRLKRKLNDLFLKYLLIEYNSTLEEKK